KEKWVRMCVKGGGNNEAVYTVSRNSPRVLLCGVGPDEQSDSTTVIPRSFVVRIKDVPRILGEGNSMLMNISEVSGASLSLSVDMRNVMNRTMQIKAWGRRQEVDVAETMIFNLIKEAGTTRSKDKPKSKSNVTGNDDLLKTNEISYLAWIRVREVWSTHSLS
ncbi:zinc finger, CCHC-type containing protein, partial [Tanacetum coccineum]